jgi:hypothetical protein
VLAIMWDMTRDLHPHKTLCHLHACFSTSGMLSLFLYELTLTNAGLCSYNGSINLDYYSFSQLHPE